MTPSSTRTRDRQSSAEGRWRRQGGVEDRVKATMTAVDQQASVQEPDIVLPKAETIAIILGDGEFDSAGWAHGVVLESIRKGSPKRKMQPQIAVGIFLFFSLASP